MSATVARMSLNETFSTPPSIGVDQGHAALGELLHGNGELRIVGMGGDDRRDRDA